MNENGIWARGEALLHCVLCSTSSTRQRSICGFVGSSSGSASLISALVALPFSYEPNLSSDSRSVDFVGFTPSFRDRADKQQVGLSSCSLANSETTVT